jgi:TRAP transporter TAXI family solute receptor
MDSREYRFLMPGHNWIQIGSMLGLGLAGYNSPLPKGSSVALVMADPGVLCMDGPKMVSRGEADVCMTTPTWYGAAAYSGKWDFDGPQNVKAIATFPHDDRLAFAVRADTGLRSLHDVREKKYPLRVAIPASRQLHPAGIVAEEVLAQYGVTLKDIEAWGGAVLPRISVAKDAGAAVDPSFNAIFDEAIMTRRWHELTDDYDLRFLPLDEDVLAHFERRGIPRGTIAKGRLRGIEEDVPALDFTGWVLLARGDLPDEFTYILTKVLDEQKEAIHAMFGPQSGLTGHIDLAQSAREVPLPLHPGAEAYYREKGYL